MRQRHDGLDTGAYDAVARRARDANDWAPRLTAFSDCKHLFRRDRVTELGLRFDESLRWSEDTVFSAKYVAASTVDMVDDYDCYYYRLRDDGNNLTTMLAGTESHLRAVEVGLWLQEEHDELRWRRDQHVRDAVVEITDQVFGERFLRQDPAGRRGLVDRARALLEKWLTPRSVARLPALGRLKVHLVGQGMEPELSELIRVVAAGGRGRDVVRDGRVYGGYPYFRDPVLGFPDDCYDVTGELEVRHHLAAMSWDGPRMRLAGHAYVQHVDTVDVTTELVLRERLGRLERRWPVRPVPTPELTEQCGLGRYHYGLAGFEVEVDCADVGDGRPLAAGKWGAFLAVGAQGVTKEVPLGGSRADAVDRPLETPVTVPAASRGAVDVSAHFTKYGTLTLDVGG
jgi:poly(ribitol-phosphate) beta-N-acetylglucosaminyltransferase